MNYTINEIPNTATEANNTDYAIMWQDKTKKISISNLFKKLVKKSEVTNAISPINENPVTSKAVSSLLTISVSTTTITDAPPLQNGTTLRIFFTSEITGTDNTTVLQITYNGTTYNVKVPKDGALQNYVAFEVSSGVFKYLQAYTTLELLFDGTQFVIIGNPVVLSGSNYLYYADGSHNVDEVTSGNMQSVTSNAVMNSFSQFSKLQNGSITLQFNALDTSCVPLITVPANTLILGYVYSNLGTQRFNGNFNIKDVISGLVDTNISSITIRQNSDYEYVILPFLYKTTNEEKILYSQFYMNISGSIKLKLTYAFFNNED